MVDMGVLRGYEVADRVRVGSKVGLDQMACWRPFFSRGHGGSFLFFSSWSSLATCRLRFAWVCVENSLEQEFLLLTALVHLLLFWVTSFDACYPFYRKFLTSRLVPFTGY